ncbi:MAG: hypothetical protein C0424_00065 [Sphingobacteriaceae bacterium]|nr:hypothetical protein [Sphingobacteriaceae bacterium]
MVYLGSWLSKSDELRGATPVGQGNVEKHHGDRLFFEKMCFDTKRYAYSAVQKQQVMSDKKNYAFDL